MTDSSTKERIAEIENWFKGDFAQPSTLGDAIAFLLDEVKRLMADRAKDWKIEEECQRLFAENEELRAKFERNSIAAGEYSLQLEAVREKCKIYDDALESMKIEGCYACRCEEWAREALEKGRA